ncbi:MAG: short-chain dehydrogenase, partial [Pseudomonadota bacterium]
MSERSILITGCSSGIGYHAAHALKGLGWRVFASCRKQADCDRLIGEGLESPRIDYQDTA